MTAKVWVYPEQEWQSIGASRWLIEWSTEREEAKGQEDFDHFRDLDQHHALAATRKDAQRVAQQKLPLDFYGVVRIRRQVVVWLVQEDNVAEWAEMDDDDNEEIS